jgi:hypothetical protein
MNKSHRPTVQKIVVIYKKLHNIYFQMDYLIQYNT